MDTGRDASNTRSLNRHTLEQIVAVSSAPLLVAHVREGRFTVAYVNSAYERLSDYKAAELVGRPWPLLERGADEGIAALKAAVERREPCCVKIADVRKDGTALPCEINLTPLRDAHGEIRYVLCDVRSLASAESVVENHKPTLAVETTGEQPLLQLEPGGRVRAKLAAMERVDSATGLLKLGYFQETLRRDLAVARRDQRFVTLLVFEIVEFDAYRRTYGDKAADSCQRMIGAQVMRTLRRAGDICARYDESTLVAATLGQEPRDVQPLIDQIAGNVLQLKLHNPRAKSSRTIAVRVSVVGCAPGAHEDPEPLIARALAESRAEAARPHAIPA